MFPASIQKVERSCEQRNESSLGDRPNRRRAAVDTRKNSYRSSLRSPPPFSIAHLFGKQSRLWVTLYSQARNSPAPIARHFRACHEDQKRSAETTPRVKCSPTCPDQKPVRPSCLHHDSRTPTTDPDIKGSTLLFHSGTPPAVRIEKAYLEFVNLPGNGCMTIEESILQIKGNICEG